MSKVSVNWMLSVARKGSGDITSLAETVTR